MSDNKGGSSTGNSYRFTRGASGAVTNLQELEDGAWKTEAIGRNEK